LTSALPLSPFAVRRSPFAVRRSGAAAIAIAARRGAISP